MGKFMIGDLVVAKPGSYSQTNENVICQVTKIEDTLKSENMKVKIKKALKEKTVTDHQEVLIELQKEFEVQEYRFNKYEEEEKDEP